MIYIHVDEKVKNLWHCLKEIEKDESALLSLHGQSKDILKLLNDLLEKASKWAN